MTATALRLARGAARSAARRSIHRSAPRLAITNLEMPAMSPTMTEGGISSWKKLEGDAFSAGDVLLEIETDKATIDVEAQEDGIMGKIIVQNGAKGVQVGKIIALLAEEGDDISNLEVPKESEKPAPAKETSSSSPPPASPPPTPKAPAPEPVAHSTHASHPTHSRPLFPSVYRLLVEKNVTNPSEIKGTGIRGMLTKGDVLAHLGLASGPLGTFKESPSHPAPPIATKAPEYQPLNGQALRQLIVTTMLQRSLKARNTQVDTTPADFESLISDYLPPAGPKLVSPACPIPLPPTKRSDFLEGLV